MAPRGGARALETVRCSNALLLHARCDTFVEPLTLTLTPDPHPDQ
jgi:hypothetical protein